MRAINSLMLKLTYMIIVAIILVISYEVIARSFFNAPTSWYLEVASLLQALGATLAGAYLLQEDSHLGVDFLTDRLSERWKNRLLLINSSFGAIITAVIAYIFAKECLWSFSLTRVTDNAFLPIAPFQAISCFGIALLSVQFVLRAKKAFHDLSTPQ